MGKAYTDDALGKYELSLVTQTLEGHVLVLSDQIQVFREQLEANRKLAAEYQHANEFHKMTNEDQYAAVENMRRILTGHEREAVQRQVEVRQLLSEIEDGNRNKAELTEELTGVRLKVKEEAQALEKVRKAIEEETRHLQEARRALLDAGSGTLSVLSSPSPFQFGAFRREIPV